MSERCPRPNPNAGRAPHGNSARVEAVRIALQLALTSGQQVDVANSLAGVVCLGSVREQIGGHEKKRLSATVLFAGLAHLPMEQRLPMLQNLAEPLGLVVSIAQRHEEGDPLSSLALAVAEVGDVSRAILEALQDGHMDERERMRALREIAEAKAALTHLEKVVSK